jgi:transcriptional regulator with XRE-family HTH domain
MHLSANLLLLRKHRKKTQDDIAVAVGVSRTNYVKYESGGTTPSLPVLIALSDYFKVGLDYLIRMDLSKMGKLDLYQLESHYLKGTYLRILPTTIGPDGKENIELVTERAKAGYKAGFADPEFIGQLPTFRLPFLHPERKYRAFPVSGDSMLPIPDGAYVVGEYVVEWDSLREGEAYLLVMRDDGIVFKIIGEQTIRKDGKLLLLSRNPLYQPYQIHISEVMEIWKFSLYLSSLLPGETLSQEELLAALARLQEDVSEIKGYVKG